MVAPDQLAQSDVRVRQAKQKFETRFGGLCTVLSGDFLQLPPVDRQGLAQVLNEAGFFKEDENRDDAD